MKKEWIVLLAAIVLLSGSHFNAGKTEFPRSFSKTVSSEVGKTPDFGKIPLYFIPNCGQVSRTVVYYTKTPGYTLWITKKGLVFDSFGKFSPRRDVSRLVFPGSNGDPEIVPANRTGYRVHYFKGKNRSGWLNGIKTSKAVRYKGIYKNIDLKIYGIGKQIEYDWIVKPGGAPGKICFEYKNVKKTKIDPQGNLIVETTFGKLKHQKPVGYQMKRDKCQELEIRNQVNVGFKKIRKNVYGFEVGEYDRNLELIIDPVIVVYSTFLGGNRTDMSYNIVVDASGSAYIAGRSYSDDFPTLDPLQQNKNVDNDVFVTKFSPDGTALSYSTYLGGSGSDKAFDITIDTLGYVYITGETKSTDFPTYNSFQDTYGGGPFDAFVAKISPEGDSLSYCTYLGGNGTEIGRSIAVDTLGFTYTTGHTESTNFPVLNAYQSSIGGSDDGFVTKLSPTGNTLSYSTYLGGSNNDHGEGIAVDTLRFAYITGFTESTDFPVLNAFQAALKGENDVFVIKLSPSGNSLSYSTYLGGSESDRGLDIGVSPLGHAYVTGETYSTDFPMTGPLQNTRNGPRDAFVTKFSLSGETLSYSTFLGGSHWDCGDGITLDTSGSVYITGSTRSNDFPTLDAIQDFKAGLTDAFVTRLSPSGNTLLYSSYLGGSGWDHGRGITVDELGSTYIVGHTDSPDFPVKNSFQGNFMGGQFDAFVTKINLGDTPPDVSISSPSDGSIVRGNVKITALTKDDFGISQVNFYVDSELKHTVNQPSISPFTYMWDTTTYPFGKHRIRVLAYDSGGQTASDEISVYVKNIVVFLQVTRYFERAWIIKRQYGKIGITVDNPYSISISKFIIYKKESGGEFQSIKEIPVSEFPGTTYIYYDKYLEDSKSYFYKIEVRDSSGKVIALSDEKSI